MTTAAVSRVRAAVGRLEACGSSSQDRGAVFAALLVDRDLLGELAGLSQRDRDAALQAIAAAVKRSGRIADMRAAVTPLLRERLEGGQGKAGRVFGMRLPASYYVSDRGELLQRIVTEDAQQAEVLVALRRIAITGRVVDPSEGRVHVEVTWATAAGSESAVVPRVAVTDARQLVASLSESGSEGAPVNSGNARRVVEYLAAQEDRAGKDMPAALLARGLGWVDDATGEPAGFMAGHTLLQDGRAMDTREPGWGPRHVVLDRAVGLQSLAQRVRSGGTFAGWREAVEPALAFPVVGLCLCAALAPVLLRVVDVCESAGILDIAGPQSTGKTRAVEIGALSVWGPGDFRLGPGISLEGSDAGLREYRRQCGYLPVLLNETQHLRNRPEAIAALPFQLYEGQGKVLSNGNGSTRPLTCSRSGAILSGNTSLVDLVGEDVEGVRTRVLTFHGHAWGAKSKEISATILRARAGVLEHYGHLGPAFAALIERRRGIWDDLRRSWARQMRRWHDELGLGAERAADVLALYEVAGTLAVRELGVPMDVDLALAAGAAAARTSTGDMDVGLRAIRAVGSWASGQQLRFDGRCPDSQAPHGGFLGRWEQIPGAPLSLLQEPLCAFLRLRHLPIEDVLRNWHGRGWLLSDEAGKRTRKVQVGSARSRCYALSPAAMDAAGLS